MIKMSPDSVRTARSVMPSLLKSAAIAFVNSIFDIGQNEMLGTNEPLFVFHRRMLMNWLSGDTVTRSTCWSLFQSDRAKMRTAGVVPKM